MKTAQGGLRGGELIVQTSHTSHTDQQRPMIRLWVGKPGQPLRRGTLCVFLNDALGWAHRLARHYVVGIEVGPGKWHVFDESRTTILGPTEDRSPYVERRGAERRANPLPAALARNVTVNDRPARLVDVSATGARVKLAAPDRAHAGEIIAIQINAVALIAHLAGQVRWARDHECGIEFDPTLMTDTDRALLHQLLS